MGERTGEVQPKGMVLLVEDHEDDIALAQRAFRRLGLAEPCVLRDGAAALDFLDRVASGAARPPTLILLDLNLPKVSGLDVLREAKRQPALRRLPIVVFTSSRHEADLRAAYDAGTNSYVVKPVEFGHFVEALRAIATFWLGTAEPPPPATPRPGRLQRIE